MLMALYSTFMTWWLLVLPKNITLNLNKLEWNELWH